jgi:FkbM family methyltransferase
MDLYPLHLATWSRARLEIGIKRRTQIAYLGDGIVLARVLGRHKMFLQTADRGFGCHVMLDGYWEIWLTQFLARIVTAGMTVIDVGANFGYYTLLMADAVGPAGQVLAVEPNPATVSLLRETISLNGYADRTVIVPQALSDKEGSALLFCPHGEPKNALLVPHRDYPGGTTIEISTTSLDNVAEKSGKVDLIKIDAEGAEIAIVRGMQKLIHRDKPKLVLEFNAARYPDPDAFLELLMSAYGNVQELTLEGALQPLDRTSVTDKMLVRDRILFFQ